MGTKHQHTHDHTHVHADPTAANKRTLLIAFSIIAAFMFVEIIGGIITGSLALLADAGHMLSDAISLLIAFFAIRYGSRAARATNTYGFRRIEILAAFLNGVTLIAVAGYIIVEGILRFKSPQTIEASGMLIIASIGLMVNILVAWMMWRSSDVKDNLNMRGAFLHVISDLLGSVAAIIAGLALLFWNVTWVDPLVSILIALLILRSGFQVSKSALHVLMEGTPANMDAEVIAKIILQHPNIQQVHDLHIWSITSGQNMLTCHLVVDAQLKIAETQEIVQELNNTLAQHQIQHCTFQFEGESHKYHSDLYCANTVHASANNPHDDVKASREPSSS